MQHLEGVTIHSVEPIMKLNTSWLMFAAAALVFIGISVIIFKYAKENIGIILGAVFLCIGIIGVFTGIMFANIDLVPTENYYYYISLSEEVSYTAFTDTYEIVEKIGDSLYKVRFK